MELKDMARVGALALSALLCLIPMMAQADVACGSEAFGARKVKPCPDRRISCYLVYPQAPNTYTSIDSQPIKHGVYLNSDFGSKRKGLASLQRETIAFDLDNGFLMRNSAAGAMSTGPVVKTKLTPAQLAQLTCFANQLWETDVLADEAPERTRDLDAQLPPDTPDLYEELVLKDGDNYQVLRDSAVRKGAAAALLTLMEKLADACLGPPNPLKYVELGQVFYCNPRPMPGAQ